MNTSQPYTNIPSNFRNWGIVALLLILATSCALILDHHVSITSLAMVYLMAVVIASYRLRWQHSVACAIGAVSAFNFFFVPPRWTFEVDSREHLITLFAMLLVALVISHLAARLRNEADSAHRNMLRASQLQELASQLSLVQSQEDIASLGQKALTSAFEGPCVLSLCRPDGEGLDLPEGLLSNDSDGMHCCMREGAVLGPGTGRWPGLNAWFMPLGTRPEVFGAVCIQPALATDIAGREHGQALCALLEQALQRLRLTHSMQTAQIEVQRQQLQSTYLASISHDLRTPLAAMVGAATALQTQSDKLSSAEQNRLLGSIVSEATHINTITENTLQLVRLANAPQSVKRDWESMEEIVGAVLGRVRQRDTTRRIKLKVPERLPLIQADPVLLAQLITNLLDNALKYSDDTIDLNVTRSEDTLHVAVKDRGIAIAPEKYASIFEPYARSDQSGQRGAGLGLALCRAIASAHGGTLTVRRRSGGGNSFTFSMPLDAHQPESAES